MWRDRRSALPGAFRPGSTRGAVACEPAAVGGEPEPHRLPCLPVSARSRPVSCWTRRRLVQAMYHR